MSGAHTSRVVAIALRLGAAALSITAMTYQLVAVHIPRGYSVPDYFWYFTNLSNIMISIVFVVSAVRLIRGRTDPSSTDVALRGAAVVYIAFVGLVFNTLLTDVDISSITPWVNTVVHFVLPAAGIVDWILWPPRRRIPLRVVGWWMVWPAVYAAASLVREALTGWYAYPFFSDDAVGGYGVVVALVGVMIVGFALLALGVRAVGNALGARRWHREAEPAAAG
ncbi:Pr6Pr family membrane protein [Agrococcus sp. SGAir0287]|uniref:Pr6Pr family membrane protein n=1 Tax=Agrococcus sp. SGAir0287 TaxID=2070347 RepID=UPI0010CD065B|nr:Pr6Pr family membrane protein [Agrococcus sp. SGAir0287]QCR19048.1 hypothetical protein C1N71_06005 [Agrococcus sp. SGAir0287]